MQNPHHSKTPRPGTAEKSTGFSAGWKQGHYVCLGLQPPPWKEALLALSPPYKHSAEPELLLNGRDTCTRDLGSHRSLKDWPFSHFKGLLFTAFQLSLVRSRKSEWWCPQPELTGCDSALSHHPPSPQVEVAAHTWVMDTSGHSHQDKPTASQACTSEAAASNLHITQLELYIFRVSSQPKGLKNSKMCSESKE